MTILECFESCNDADIEKILGGKRVEIKHKDGSTQIGLVTNFIVAAVANDANRYIVGVILDKQDEIIVSTTAIDNIYILN